MTVTVRRATAGDERTCKHYLQLLREAASAPVPADFGPTFVELLAAGRGEVLLAVEDDAGAEKVLGMATVSYNLALRYGGEYAQLEELIVDPEARGKNVGGVLMNEVVARAKARGCAEFGLYLVEATEHNQPFYEKFGFERVGSEMRQSLS